MSNILRSMALKQMEKEYRKLYKAGQIIIIDDTEQMAKDIVSQSPVSLDTIGVIAQDIKSILDKLKKER